MRSIPDSIPESSLNHSAKSVGIRAVHALLISRLRMERLTAVSGETNASPRILATVCGRFPVYSQTFVYQELSELRRRGFDLRILYSKLADPKDLPEEFSNLWPLRRKFFRHRNESARAFRYFRRRMPEAVERLTDRVSQASGISPAELSRHEHFLHAFQFARMVEAWRPDYLHSYFFYEGSLFSLVASSLLDIPRGVTCYADHNLQDYELKLVPLHLRTCDLVVATSNRIKTELESMSGAESLANIVVKPNSIAASGFLLGSRPDPMPGEPYRLICVSRIEPKKGLIHLVEAFGLLQNRGFRIELQLVGAPDDDKQSSLDYARMLEDRIGDLGLGESIRMSGKKTRAEVKSLLSQAHIFAAPFVELDNGDKDGIPTAVLEAMAAGSPVVTTDAGSIPEVIEDGRDGLIVPQREPGRLAEAIARLLVDGALRERLGRCAAGKVRRQFDVAQCEAILHDRIRRIVSLRRQSAGSRADTAGIEKGAFTPVDDARPGNERTLS